MMKITKQNINTRKQRGERGFTLIEVLVSLSIFTMVVTAAVSVMLTMVDANAKAQNIQSVMTNLAFSIDSMSREIRTGYGYYCESGSYGNLGAISNSLPISGNSTRDCESSNSNRYAIAFQEGGGSLTDSCSDNWIAYRYNPYDKSIERRLCDGDGSGGSNDASDWLRLTSDSVEIDTLTFTLNGSDPDDNVTPIVVIYVSGTILGPKETGTSFSMQTMVSQYLLDL